MNIIRLTAAFALLFGTTSCAIIGPTQVGVKQRFGKLSEEVYQPGITGINPLTTRMIRVHVQTKNLSIEEDLPSREGLTIRSESSILYSIQASEVPRLIKETGLFYERDLLMPVYRSAAADICSQYDAKDMHSSKRGEIEQAIQARMSEILAPKGIRVESVLLKSIKLPFRISESIERKLEAEQEALRLRFVADQQRREMERQIIQEEGQRDMARIRAEGEKQATLLRAEADFEARVLEARAKAESIEIEAKALREFNQMLNQTLSKNILDMKRIEAFRDLAGSESSKVLMLDGKSSVVNLLGELGR
jgi:prohibitin 1